MSEIDLSAVGRRAVIAGLSASLAACAAPRRLSGTDAEVIVIGAGLAGLHATALLENAGYKVLLVEGNNRTGGRLHTLDRLPGAPDAGGIQVGASYQRFNSIADRLKIERYLPASPSKPGNLYNIGGETFLKEAWAAHLQNRLAPAEKAIEPDAHYFGALGKLPKLAQVSDWMTSGAALDVSLADWLRQNGASDEAMRLMDSNLNGRTLAKLSTLHMQRALASFGAAAQASPGPTKYVRGGSQRMTDAMTAELRSDIMMNAPVKAIREQPGKVEVTLVNDRKLSAKQVICTIPFTILRGITIHAALPEAFRTTIQRLPYTKASFAFLRASTPFWKDDGLPETIWSDDPLIGRVFTLDGDPPLLKVWVNGPRAEALDKMEAVAAGKEMIRRIEKIRPSAQGKLEYVDMFSWQKQPFAGGIYHHIGTGLGASLAATVQHQGQRLHFAGEHMAQLAPGMEGALESGERAATQVIAKL